MAERTQHSRPRFAVLTEDSGGKLPLMDIEDDFTRVDRLVRGYVTSCFLRDEEEKERIWEEIAAIEPHDVTMAYVLGSMFSLVSYTMQTFTGIESEAELISAWAEMSFEIEQELMLGVDEDDS